MASRDVFRELDTLRKEMDDAFRGIGVGRSMGTAFLSPITARRFPQVNVHEDEGHVYVDVLVPGVDPQDIELTALRNTITIAGERKPPVEEKGQVIHRSELGFGKFSRTLEVPVDIDPNRISAEYRDGVMRMTLAKHEHARPKKIDIKLA